MTIRTKQKRPRGPFLFASITTRVTLATDRFIADSVCQSPHNDYFNLTLIF